MAQTINQNYSVPANSPDAPTVLGKAANSLQTEIDTTSGAIGIKSGRVVLQGAGILAMTLAVPTAGLPSAGGDDFKKLQILSVGAFAHTVSTPAGGLNGNKFRATYAAVGDSIELFAYQGVWYIVAGNTTNS